ncbi:zinc finger, CCHC-type containing protein [Tanacetum coccineum]
MSGKDDTSKIKEIGSTTHFQCPMLKGANYTTWAIRMQIILEANGLWEMIEPNEKTQADNKKDKTAIAFLYQALPEEQLLQITKHKTAKTVWDALKTRHVGVNRVQQAKQQTLKSEFEMLQMEENESIDSFVTRLTGIINKAASVGLTYEDSTLVRKLLNAIPDRFLQIVASIEQYSDLDEMSLDEAIGRLKTFEERLKYKNKRPVNTQESLLFTRHEDQGQQFRKRGHGGFNQSRGQENNFKKETNNNSNKFTHDKSKVLCFKCKEYGHFANKCPSRKEEQSNLIEEDLEPTLLMATIEEAPECESLDGGITESMNRPGIKEDIYTATTPIGRQSVGDTLLHPPQRCTEGSNIIQNDGSASESALSKRQYVYSHGDSENVLTLGNDDPSAGNSSGALSYGPQKCIRNPALIENDIHASKSTSSKRQHVCIDDMSENPLVVMNTPTPTGSSSDTLADTSPTHVDCTCTLSYRPQKCTRNLAFIRNENGANGSTSSKRPHVYIDDGSQNPSPVMNTPIVAGSSSGTPGNTSPTHAHHWNKSSLGSVNTVVNTVGPDFGTNNASKKVLEVHVLSIIGAAANYLNIKTLLELTCKRIVDIAGGKTV